MKNFILFCIVLFGVYSCSSTKSIDKSGKENSTSVSNDTIRIANDNLEYEIIIVEPGFNSWLATQRSKEHYSLSLLENKNSFMVSSYNSRVTTGDYNRDLYSWEINYDSTLKYGLEVNYLLYQYLQYFQEKYNQKL
ncbi:hypothetical protein LX95_01005 [Mesonia algae]|uniref:Lipoprotein n=1 Tax=Mesonia algae TaxID=213248 RepID=A0A2W7I8M2_9FLAO|nr:DUF6146 family protein [Mesonia algae]PZW42689.1 hypothetical protein LX95_01005 [Mesonia algae]